MNKRFLYIMALILVLFFLPLTSFAQSTGFTVSPTDLSKTMFLDKFFGPLTGASTSSPFGEMIKVFNGGILLLAGIYMLYIYISGTAQGAHDGQFLGKRWSSLWVPIRMLIGTVLAFPSLSGGFCLAQYAVLWIAMQGIGFANQIWSAYENNLGTATANSLPIGSQPYTIARQLFLNNLCVDLFNNAIGKNNTSNLDSGALSSLQSITKNIKFEASAAPSGNNYNIDYKIISDDSSGSQDDVCGNAYVPLPSTVATPTPQGVDSGAISQSTATLNILNQVSKQMSQVHQTALVQMQAQTASLAMQYASNPTSNIGTQLRTIANAYTDELKSVQSSIASTLNNASSQNQKNTSNDGWIMAGSKYIQLAQMSNAISNSLYGYPTVLASKFMTGEIKKVDDLSDSDESILEVVDEGVRATYVKAATQTIDYKTANSVVAQNDVGLNKTEDSDKLSKFIGQIFSDSEMNPANIMQVLGQNPETNPMTIAAELGHASLNIAWICLGAGVVIGFLSSLIGGLALSLWMFFIGVGVLFSYIIPMIPFLYWLGGILSWGVLLIEAMIAAPIWAVAHLSPEGDGMTGKASSGYKLIIALALRPVLMVFGLVAANISFTVFAGFFNDSFGIAFSGLSDNQSSPNRLIALMTGIGIYGLGLAYIGKKSFGLISWLPEKIMRWMQAEESGYGEFGHEMGATALAGGYALNKFAGGVAGLANQAHKSVKNLKDQGKDNDGGGNGNGMAMQLRQAPNEEGGSGSLIKEGKGALGDSVRRQANVVYGHTQEALNRSPTLASAYNSATSPQAKKGVITTATQEALKKIKTGTAFKDLPASERSLIRAYEAQKKLSSMENDLKKMPDDE